MTPRRFTMRLMSDKMMPLPRYETMPKPEDVQTKTKRDCSKPSPRLWSMMKVQQDPEDRPNPTHGTAQTTTTSTV